MPPEVFITGIGIVSPAGIGTEATWQGLLAGGRYVRHTRALGLRSDPASGNDLDPAGCTTQLAAEVRGFTPPRGTEKLDRVCQFAIAAAEEAMSQAGLLGAGSARGGLPILPRGGEQPRSESPERVPIMVSVGTSKGGILSFAELAPLLTKNRHRNWSVSPSPEQAVQDALFSIPPDSPARCIAERFNVTSGIHATVAACSTGTLAVIRAARFIEDGQADRVICGSADASLHKLWFAAFEQMGVLAREHPAHGPAWTCRPFDRTRDGFALGEGAGILVLESGRSVRRRDVAPVARLAGAASGTDPAGLAQVGPDAEPLAHVIRLACERAACRPENITCVHAHGTATPANDHAESQGIRLAFGERAASLPVISIKGAVGHLLGGAGAVEIGAAALTCRHGLSPGTATLIEPDQGLGLMNLPCEAFRPDRGPVLKTSLGFGGHVAAVVLAPV